MARGPLKEIPPDQPLALPIREAHHDPYLLLNGMRHPYLSAKFEDFLLEVGRE